MRRSILNRRAILFCLAAALLCATVPRGRAAATAPQPNIAVNGFYSVDRAQRGRTIQAAVALDIPDGFHVQSNRPTRKFDIPTEVRVEAPAGVRVGPVSYPRAILRRFKFSGGERISVYEGRAVMRFNVTIPANHEAGVTELRLRVRFQSCNDEACFQPVTRNITLPIEVVGANEPVRRINAEIFGGGGRRGRRG